MLNAFVTQRKSRFHCPALAALPLVLTSVSFAVPPLIQIPRIETPPTLSDFEDMQPNSRFAGRMLKVTGFIAREPADGAEPTQNTDVYLAYDDRNLYAVFFCWDQEPGKIRARMTRREDIFSDDSVEIMIDTFNDARRGYAFAANPLGVQWDALWTEARSVTACLSTTAASTLRSIPCGAPMLASPAAVISCSWQFRFGACAFRTPTCKTGASS